MRAFYIVGAVIVVAVIYTYFLMADQPQSRLPTAAELETVDVGNTAGSKADTLNASVAEVDAEPAHSTSPKPETTHPNSGKSIDDDWCIANTELAENDFRLAQEQKREWDLVRGDLSLAFVKANPDAPNAEYLQPYAELSRDDLIVHAKNDDKYALLVLSQRDDIDTKDKERAAKQLVILGHTSKALSYLIVREMSQAQVAFQKADAVVPEVKKHVANMLSYVKYGLTRKDPSALLTYMMFVERHHKDQLGFNPESVLNEEELTRIDSHTQKFVDMLDSRRAKRYLQPIQEVEIPAIAKPAYDYKLAYAHYLYGKYLTHSRTIKTINPEATERSSCVEKILSHVGRTNK